MKKYDVLKIVVIVQALGMIALAAVVVWNYVPSLMARQNNDASQQPIRDVHDKDDEVVAVILDENITKQQLMDELLELYGDQRLEQMLTHRAIALAAKEKGITLSTEELSKAIAEAAKGYENEEQYFAMMRDQVGLSRQRVIDDITDHALLMKLITDSAEISEEQITAYIESHKEELEPKQRLDLSWILSATKKESEMLMTMLDQGADFSELASQFSIDPYTAEQGGRLGQIDSDDPFYDEQIRQEAMMLNIGDMVGPIETSEGYAIIQLLGRQREKARGEEELRAWAKTQLALESVGSLSDIKQQLLNRYVTVIRK